MCNGNVTEVKSAIKNPLFDITATTRGNNNLLHAAVITLGHVFGENVMTPAAKATCVKGLLDVTRILLKCDGSERIIDQENNTGKSFRGVFNSYVEQGLVKDNTQYQLILKGLAETSVTSPMEALNLHNSVVSEECGCPNFTLGGITVEAYEA